MKKLFYFYFLIYYIFLGVYAYFMDIGDIEVKYLSQNYPISLIENIFLYLFGNSNFVLRLPSLILSFFSIVLYYFISKKYLTKSKDIYLTTIIFSLMPGFIIASLLFNKSIYLIFLVLLFIYSFLYYRFYSYILLALFTITDYSFISLYMALIFYSIYKRQGWLLFYSIILLGINGNYFNYDIGGHPKGHFIDVLFIYFAIFSPFVFLYFIYALLKTFKNPNLLWFISVWGLVFSFILSFRQRIKIDDFAPYVIVSIIFMISVFLKDYRIRLKIFRYKFKLLFLFLFLSLVLFDTFLFSSIYLLNKKIFTQFRYSFYISKVLKQKNIPVKCKDEILCQKLYFYGVNKGNNYLIFDKKNKKVSISHNNKKILEFYVSNLNKK